MAWVRNQLGQASVILCKSDFVFPGSALANRWWPGTAEYQEVGIVVIGYGQLSARKESEGSTIDGSSSERGN